MGGQRLLKEDEDEASFLGALGRGFYVRRGELSSEGAFRGQEDREAGGGPGWPRAGAGEFILFGGGGTGKVGDLEAG